MSRQRSSSMQRYIVGIDEAGRGPLAGPVAVGIFAIPARFNMRLLAGIRDSKRMSASQRDAWNTKLRGLPGVRYAVGFSSARYIDAHGINAAVRRAMAHALRTLRLEPNECSVLLDGGLTAPHTYGRQRTIIHGDDIEPVISAASVLAKVARDTLMRTYDKRHPGYGFAVHKGYGTAAHRAAIKVLGVTEEHRGSFIH